MYRQASQAKRILLATLLLMTLLWAPSASAAPFGPPEEQAFAVAAAYWGMAPNCSSLASEVTHLEDAAGRATVGAGGPCVLLIDEGQNRFALCRTMLHEYAHLLGFEHSDPAMQVDFSEAPPCVEAREAEEAEWEQSAEFRRIEWSNWRTMRSWCRVLQRPARRQGCFSRLRAKRARLQARRPPARTDTPVD
jgi:hypothetical protein